MGRRQSGSAAIVAVLVATLLGGSAPAPVIASSRAASASSAAAAPPSSPAAAVHLPAVLTTGARGGIGSIKPVRQQVDLQTAPRTTNPDEVHGLGRLAAMHTAARPYRGPAPQQMTRPAAPGSGPRTGPQAGHDTGPAVTPPTSPGMVKGADFPGLSFCEYDDTCYEPPNSAVAVSGSYVVELDNTAVAVFDRSGKALIDPAPFSALFAEPAGETGDSDPHVLFDAVKGLWFATELSWDCSTQVGTLYLAASETADPTGVWDSFRFSLQGYLPDYPDLAVSSDKVVVSANTYQLTTSGGRECFGDFTGALIGAMDLAAVQAKDPTYVYSLADDYANAASWRPAAQPTSSAVYVLGEGFDQDVLYGRITGTQAAKDLAFATVYDLTSYGKAAAFATPPMPEQPGTPATIADAFDERPTDAVWSAGRLWFVATTSCTPSGDTKARDCVRLVQLTTNAVPAVDQDLLISDDGFDDFMGGIGLSGVGALFVVYSQSSPTVFVSNYVRMQEPGAAAGTFGAPLEVETGLGTYDGTRWGDYALVSDDPAMPTAVWEADEYPTADGGWATAVTQLFVEATYVSLPGPVRILDTRNGTGLSGPFVNHKPRTFQVTGKGGVPADAVAVTGNLTVTGQAAAGYVSLTTAPLSSPSTSTLNVPLGDVRANGVTTSLGGGGTLSATYVGGSATSSTHLAFDVTGYFLPTMDGATFSPLSPARILDTRAGTGLVGPLVRGMPRSFAVAGHGGVPTDAVAITGNLTVAGQTAAGYVSLTTRSTPLPGTSTINFRLADVRANGVTMPLGTGADLGTLWATYIGGTTGASVQVVFDVTGYYAPGAAGALYVPLAPVRDLDTRSATGLSGPFVNHIARTLQVSGRDNVPATANGITGNLTMVAQTASGYVSITQTPTTDPTTSTLNAPKGDIRANNLAAPLTLGAAGVRGKLSGTYVGGPTSGHDSTQLILDVTGYFIRPPT